MESLKINTETTTLVDLVEESLLKYIKEKNLKPGDRLLHEEELSEQLGVGRNVDRDIPVSCWKNVSWTAVKGEGSSCRNRI